MFSLTIILDIHKDIYTCFSSEILRLWNGITAYFSNEWENRCLFDNWRR